MSGALRVWGTPSAATQAPGPRRCIGSSSASVHRVFQSARTHDLDLHGREVLEFLPGHVPAIIAVRGRDLYDVTAVRAADAGPASEFHPHLSSYEVVLAELDELPTDE